MYTGATHLLIVAIHTCATYNFRLCPTHASAHNNLGTVLTSTAEAEKHFRKAININLHHAGAHYNLAMLYRYSPTCNRYMQCSLNAHWMYNGYYGNLLFLEEISEKSERSICCCNTPHLSFFISSQFCLNRRRGQVEVARGLLERSLALDASLAEAASSLAELEGQRGRTNEAEKLHRRAIELNGRSAPIRNNYGTFLHHQGKWKRCSNYRVCYTYNKKMET